ncbi:MAG: phosphatidylserine decarboxylase family protein [Bacteroidales bacterium]|nr:phosphatidylserine decarboxylase family protein [Candidatus Physcousia equi]
MGKRLRKLRKKITLHREGTNTLVVGGIALLLLNGLLFELSTHYGWTMIPFYVVLAITGVLYLIVVNFFRCPERRFEEDTTGIVIAPADGNIVCIEEVEEKEYFHDRRLMVSIFMSVTNVHANWVPVDGTVLYTRHHNGNFHRAWLPKASEENERATTVIRTPQGTEVLVRQIAGAVARRIVTYTQAGDEVEIDDHLGFIKLGSRVDTYLPLGTKVLVQMRQKTVGNQTVLAKL